MPGINTQATDADRHHRQLLAAAAGGSLDAFNELYSQLYTPVTRFIYRVSQSRPLIEEVVNDVFLVVWQKASTFRGDSRVMTWVLGIAHRRALKSLSKDQTWHRHAALQQPPSANNDDLAMLATRDAVEWAMAQLSQEHRLSIEMAYYHGFSCEEIARVFDCPVNTAKTRLHYGRQKLRAVLEQDDAGLAFKDIAPGAKP